jgi:hypothetical protein
MAKQRKQAMVPQRKSAKQPKLKQRMSQLSLVGNYSNSLTNIPTAVNVIKSNRNPMMKQSSNRELRVSHCEYVADLVKSSTALWSVTNTFSIQPGNPSSFPWLSTIAGAYEMYRINSMRFVIRSVNSSAVAGGVYMNISYDADDDAPITKAYALAEESAVAGTYWSPMSLEYLPIRGKPYNERFTAISTPAGQPKKLYSAGNLFISCDGNSSNIIGDLYCEYDITLISPSLQGFAPAVFSQEISSATGTITDAAATTLGRSIALPGAGTLTTGTLTFQQVGQFLVEVYLRGNATTAASVATFTPVGCQQSPANGAPLNGQCAPLLNTATDPNSAHGYYPVLLNVLQVGATLAIAISNIAAISNSQIKIAPYLFSNTLS